MSGTSMASKIQATFNLNFKIFSCDRDHLISSSLTAPHVAGAVALYLTQNKNAQWTDVRTAFQSTAVPRPGNKRCSLLYGSDGTPNNDFGYGRIDVQKALGL